MILEIQDFVDQKTKRRYEAVRAWIFAHRRLLATQGTVTASWREYQGRRLGPFYRLAYREGNRQRSVYLGIMRSARLCSVARASQQILL